MLSCQHAIALSQYLWSLHTLSAPCRKELHLIIDTHDAGDHVSFLALDKVNLASLRSFCHTVNIGKTPSLNLFISPTSPTRAVATHAYSTLSLMLLQDLSPVPRYRPLKGFLHSGVGSMTSLKRFRRCRTLLQLVTIVARWLGCTS